MNGRAAIWGLITVLGVGCSGTPPTPRQKAEELLGRGEYLEAIAICDEALRVDPKNAEMLTQRGRIRIEMSDWEGAEADLKRSRDCRKEYAETYYEWARLYRKLDRQDEAQGMEQLATQYDPRHYVPKSSEQRLAAPPPDSPYRNDPASQSDESAERDAALTIGDEGSSRLTDSDTEDFFGTPLQTRSEGQAESDPRGISTGRTVADDTRRGPREPDLGPRTNDQTDRPATTPPVETPPTVPGPPDTVNELPRPTSPYADALRRDPVWPGGPARSSTENTGTPFRYGPTSLDPPAIPRDDADRITLPTAGAPPVWSPAPYSGPGSPGGLVRDSRFSSFDDGRYGAGGGPRSSATVVGVPDVGGVRTLSGALPTANWQLPNQPTSAVPSGFGTYVGPNVGTNRFHSAGPYPNSLGSGNITPPGSTPSGTSLPRWTPPPSVPVSPLFIDPDAPYSVP